MWSVCSDCKPSLIKSHFYWSYAHSLLMHEISTVMHFDVLPNARETLLLTYDVKRFFFFSKAKMPQ